MKINFFAMFVPLCICKTGAQSTELNCDRFQKCNINVKTLLEAVNVKRLFLNLGKAWFYCALSQIDLFFTLEMYNKLCCHAMMSYCAFLLKNPINPYFTYLHEQSVEQCHQLDQQQAWHGNGWQLGSCNWGGSENVWINFRHIQGGHRVI